MAQLKTQNLKCAGKVLTRLLFASLILAVVLGLTFIWLVRALPYVAIAEISELTNAKIGVESVDFNFAGSVLIKKLVISDREQSPERKRGVKKTDEYEILRADTVYARFSIGSLLLLGPRLKEIHIRDFVFNAQYDLDTDRWNIAALKINVPKNGAGRLPSVQLEKGTLQYSKVSKGQAEVLAVVPIDMRFRPAEGILGGYSFDITTAQRADSGRSRLFGSWRPGRLTIAGGISSTAIPAFISREAETLEGAWVINFLDAELSYDRSNNYSLKLKIKDLLYTQKNTTGPRSAEAHISAFDRPAFLAKSGLFTAWQRFFSRYRPAGRVDLDLEASGNFKSAMAPSKSALAGKVYCKDVSICDRKFPYAIEQVTGQVDFTENSVILNNLHGKHGAVNVTFNGWSKDFGLHPPQAGKNQQYQIQIASDNMALDKDLYDALNAKQKELWSAFSPSGLAAIDYSLSKQSQTDKGKTLMVELRGAEAAYQGFSYPLKNLTGKLSFDRDSINISDVVSQINGGKITFNGRVTDCNTDRPIYYLSIKANDISFDSALAKRLLAKQSDFYNRFDVVGIADAEVTISTPTEGLGPTSFFADLTLKKTSVQVNKSASRMANKSRQKPLVISDVSAKVIVTSDSTSIKNFTGRYGQSSICLVGGIWHTDKGQLSRYHLALTAEQVQLSDDLIGLLPTSVGKMVSHLSPEGKINLSAYLNKAAPDSIGGKDQPDYQITVNCLGDSVNFKRFAYPLRDVTGTLIITNNKVALDNITAAPAENAQGTADGSTIKLNGQITLADSTFNEGRFVLSANDIFFNEQLGRALPEGVASSYQALSPAGRFDLDLNNIKIFTEDGQTCIDFAGTARFKACHFNISGTRAELDAVLKTKGLYKTGHGFTDGQVNLTAENLQIKGKSITSLTADINYNPSASGGQSWEAENLLADCYGGRLIGTLEFSPASGRQESPISSFQFPISNFQFKNRKSKIENGGSALEYLLQVGFDNIDLSRFLAGSKPAPSASSGQALSEAEGAPETSATSHTSGIMSGSLSLSARIGDSPAPGGQDSSRIGRCRLVIKDMQVGNLSPLAKLLYTLKLKEQKDFAFEQMVIDSYIKGDKLFFEKLDLSGEAVAFYGTGWMDLQSESINLTLTARGERLAAAEPSILQSLTEGLGSAVVRMEVTGNVHDPNVETRTLPVVEDSLKILGKPR